ncbi:hypothetical protein H6P81_004771 [Aristolochia fimbriata]|uniref:DUF1664 domain-containing protein n=1 Tax=Aristolochia fimbriata TaxID=158543 RepID=A0AAV7ESN8_ARIFI|nr:hypothetical protein H6P81_004771 [Aristolochia fimbriata]
MKANPIPNKLIPEAQFYSDTHTHRVSGIRKLIKKNRAAFVKLRKRPRFALLRCLRLSSPPSSLETASAVCPLSTSLYLSPSLRSLAVTRNCGSLLICSRGEEMAMQSTMGISKILLIVGAGYTGTVVMKNGKLSDVLGELQALVKGLEKTGDSPNLDSDISSQVRRLAMEVRQLATARPITVVNGDSSQLGNVTSLIVPTAILGALGYGYMWWKGFSFSDLMYVTKRNMQNAVTGMTKHLEQVAAALDSAKRHLTQRIENLDGKLDDQREVSKLIKDEVTSVRSNLSQIGCNLETLQNWVCGLDERMATLEDKQDFANAGVWFLCQYAGAEKDPKMAQYLQNAPKSQHSFLPSSEGGLKHIKDVFQLGSDGESALNGSDGMDKWLKTGPVTRTASIKW